jgi:hypothetical protein
LALMTPSLRGLEQPLEGWPVSTLEDPHLPAHSSHS